MAIKHYLQFADFSLNEYEYLIERTKIIKRKFKNYEPYHPLLDRTLVMVFEKNSTRTRLSFEAGMHQLGGAAIYLNTRDSQLGRGEPVEDAAQVMSRMCDIIMIRTFGQEIIERFAANSRVPVINGLTNEHHPCQVFADVFTYIEHRGSIAGKTVAWVGDYNNVCRSLCEAVVMLGGDVMVGAPLGYHPSDVELARLNSLGAGSVRHVVSASEAVSGAIAVHTDTWTSMGQEAEKAERVRLFADWSVDESLMALAAPGAGFYHCLPAYRGLEVSAGVIDGPQSHVVRQAHNRMHTARAVLAFLMGVR